MALNRGSPAEVVKEVRGEDDERRIREVFARLDANGDGHITRNELRDGLKLLKLPARDADVDTLLSRLDINKDGTVSLQVSSVLLLSLACCSNAVIFVPCRNSRPSLYRKAKSYGRSSMSLMSIRAERSM